MGCPTPYDNYSNKEDIDLDNYWEWYDGNEEEIALDKTSNLLWTESLECGINWYEAMGIEAEENPDNKDPCGDLNDDTFAGVNDWRVPTKNEFMQVVSDDHSYDYNNGGGNDMYGWNSGFAGIYRYWSQNERSDDFSRTWNVRLIDGYVYNYY